MVQKCRQASGFASQWVSNRVAIAEAIDQGGPPVVNVGWRPSCIESYKKALDDSLRDIAVEDKLYWCNKAIDERLHELEKIRGEDRAVVQNDGCCS